MARKDFDNVPLLKIILGDLDDFLDTPVAASLGIRSRADGIHTFIIAGLAVYKKKQKLLQSAFSDETPQDIEDATKELKRRTAEKDRGGQD